MNRSQRIDLNTVSNIRDLGGIINRNGKKIRDRFLIRSSELSRLDEEEAKILYEQIGIKTVFDFRSPHEPHRAPDVIGGNVSYFLNEIATNESFGVRRDEETMKELDKLIRQLRESDDDEIAKEFMRHFYRSFVISNFSVSQYAKFLHYVMRSEDPVLWHCSMGKDRCGIGTALVLELLNVDRDSIREDYLYTNEVYGIYDTQIESGFEIADGSYLDAFYDEAAKIYGGMSELFEEMNIDDRELYEFRQRILV